MSSSALISSQWDISVSTNKFQEGNGRKKGIVSCTLINLSQGSVNRGTASAHPVSFSKQGVFFLFPVLFSFGFGFYRWSQHTSEHSYYYPMTPPVWLWLSPVPLRLPAVAWNRPEGWLLLHSCMQVTRTPDYVGTKRTEGKCVDEVRARLNDFFFSRCVESIRI